ncbi:glycosyl hydrolase family 28 protein [Enterobacter quasihormaechei]|uniref:glycosyl hydrolase family 28 protein n=1 Tax=Enterobacter quasihormaechei TaxID=2529382 RepID=UPI003D6F5F47
MKAISILAFGADPTAQRLSTSAIQQAINTAQRNDVIVIPQGHFLTGALFMKSGVSLRLDAGARLMGSQDLADYPLIDTRVAGIEMRWPAGIINIINCENVSITGTGTIDGQGAVWWPDFAPWCNFRGLGIGLRRTLEFSFFNLSAHNQDYVKSLIAIICLRFDR